MQKKVPIRTCIACRAQAAKGDLVRVVKSPAGGVSLDPTGKAAGRGAYICRKGACFEMACSKHLFNGKLRARLTADDYDNLREDFDALCLDSKAL